MRKILTGCLCVLLFTACNKQKESFTSPALSEYFPLEVGKYMIYRLDSTVLTPFGAALITRSYRVKDVVDAEITDAQGRKSYRIYRYLTDTGGIAPYQSNATFMATPNGTDWIEYNDDNLRFMKLRWPIRPSTKWKGNSFFADYPVSSSDPRALYYAGWTYEYDSIGMPYTLLGKTYDNTVKVFQRDDITGPLPIIDSITTQRDYSIERYAKGIGLVYKEFLHYAWQPRSPYDCSICYVGHFEDGSYGIRLRMIDHN